MHPAPVSMHIPDGFLSLAMSLVCWLLSAGILALALRHANQDFKDRQVPMMGVMAAFIFAAQMINFPVAGGTSGHLLGGTLAAILLGPWAAMLVMTAVVTVQGLLFQDGGLLAMGANILNMALLTVIVSHGINRLAHTRRQGVKLAAAGIAAWLAVMTAALSTALQLWLSGTAQLSLVVPAMLAIHALIGLGEAIITVATILFIKRTRPDLLEASDPTAGGRIWVLAGLLISLGVLLLAPLASVAPDGLERVALRLGFSASAQPSPLKYFPNFQALFTGAPALAGILAGLFGMLAVIGLVWLLIRTLHKPGK